MIHFYFRSRYKHGHGVSEIFYIRDLVAIQIGMLCPVMVVLVVAAIEMNDGNNALECMKTMQHAYAFLINIAKCICQG